MNRLWVRLSMLFTGLMFLVATVIALLFASLSPREFSAADFDGVGLSEIEADAVRVLIGSGIAQEFVRNFASIQLVAFSVVAFVAGILASIYASYRLTRPLTELEEAAYKIGLQELGYRVKVKGTDEMLALASSFNAMADGLESAEIRRQNLLADVAHELRTPLTVLQGNLRAALDDVHTLDPMQVAKLYDQTRQLNHLVNDLHDLAQAEAKRLPLNMMGVDLAELTEQAVAIFTPMAEEQGINFTIDHQAILPPLRADRARFMQVLQNLIANALRYAKSSIVVRISRDNQQAKLTIIDDGKGIGADHLAYIFDRFYRVDSSRARETGGTGLGLAIVKSIVEAHGGQIVAGSFAVDGTSDSGTAFTILLPLTPDVATLQQNPVAT